MIDAQLQNLLQTEIERQNLTLNLIASENYASKAVLQALNSPLSNKYSEGYPGKRYYPGNILVDEVETLAKSRALLMFGLDEADWHVNVQPYSGSPANIAIYSALMEPNETLMGMNLSCGGHLSHGHQVSMSGRVWKVVHYGVDLKSGLIDYDAVREMALKEKPKVIVAGFTAYSREVDFRRFGEIAQEAGAYLVADISHIAGLIAAGLHPSPFSFADAVMTTTHKTLRGPRGAIILAHRDSRDLPVKIDRAVFPGMQGGPHNNVTAAKAATFFEAMQPEFKEYQKQILKNSKALARALMDRGFTILTNGTDTHLMLMDVRGLKLDGKEAEAMLETVSITANRNSLPGDTKPLRPSGLRLGTPAVTTRGMTEAHMESVADFFERLFLKQENAEEINKDVMSLCQKFKLNY